MKNSNNHCPLSPDFGFGGQQEIKSICLLIGPGYPLIDFSSRDDFDISFDNLGPNGRDIFSNKLTLVP